MSQTSEDASSLSTDSASESLKKSSTPEEDATARSISKQSVHTSIEVESLKSGNVFLESASPESEANAMMDDLQPEPSPVQPESTADDELKLQKTQQRAEEVQHSAECEEKTQVEPQAGVAIQEAMSADDIDTTGDDGAPRMKNALAPECYYQILETIDPENRLEEDAKHTLAQMADFFIQKVIISSCDVAKSRESPVVEASDIGVVFENEHNIYLPDICDGVVDSQVRSRAIAEILKRFSEDHRAREPKAEASRRQLQPRNKEPDACGGGAVAHDQEQPKTQDDQFECQEREAGADNDRATNQSSQAENMQKQSETQLNHIKLEADQKTEKQPGAELEEPEVKKQAPALNTTQRPANETE